MLALSLLAALGLSALVRRRSRGMRAGVLIALAVVIALDLAPRGLRTNPIREPTIYRALKPLPEGIVAEYPLVPAAESTYDDLFDQQYHGMPILNGYQQGSPEEARALALADPSLPSTGPGLASLGVRYVVARNLPANGKLSFSSDFRLIAQDASGKLYRVAPTHKGIATSAVASDGFDSPEQDAQGRFSWLLKRRGTIAVTAACRRCAGTLFMRLSSFAQPRTVTALDARGRVLARRRVVDGAVLRLRLWVARSSHVTIVTSPGPQPISQTLLGSRDPRSVSINVRDLRFEARR
jgi:hypothetical protein